MEEKRKSVVAVILSPDALAALGSAREIAARGPEPTHLSRNSRVLRDRIRP